jgi:hypothetical protein
LNEGFKFNNPNVKDACGCGESFKVWWVFSYEVARFPAGLLPVVRTLAMFRHR